MIGYSSLLGHKLAMITTLEGAHCSTSNLHQHDKSATFELKLGRSCDSLRNLDALLLQYVFKDTNGAMPGFEILNDIL